ncbi:serine/threonine-protein kinase [Dactylosporangium sp. NPDC005572]|uniref:serine/threonine-protein kinase n=1 Tax=Dactylosporangium sp. NPDC005572 TaxID=3156889 RepID=UPI0033B64F64
MLARRYILKEPVGAGGMSVVWRAWDSTLERTVAVKVLDGPIGTDGGQRDRIRREARAAARIEHPNAIGVYDYGETVTPRGRIAAYVVMQLLDGASLASRLVEGPLPWPEAVAVASTVAEVLNAAHRRGVVHRDVTPENVMLTTDGVKLLDFGIAAEEGQREEVTFGTPPYVAPERLVGAPATGATDVYALGVLLYEMLTGSTPYPAATWEELERALAGGHYPPLAVPGLPARVAAICHRCLSANPRDRPTAAEVAATLNPPLPSARRRRRWLAVVSAPLALAVVLLVLVLLLQDDDPPGRPSVAPAVSIVVSVPPPIVIQPTTTVSPPVGGRATSTSTPTVGASSRPSVSPSASAPRLTPEQAGRVVLDAVDRRMAAGEVRTDVAEDIRNQVNNVLANQVDAAKKITALRDNLRSRQREGSITTQAAYAELDAAVVALGDSLAQS